MTEQYTLLKNVRLMDIEKRKTDAKDILFKKNGKGSEIVEIARTIKPEERDGVHVINMHGARACSSFTDLRASLPMLGSSYAERTASELRAAVVGGYRRILLTPTFLPLPDRKNSIVEMAKRAKNLTDCKVSFSVPLTVGQTGKTFCNFELLKEAGAVAVSADHENRELTMGQLFEGVERVSRAGLLFIAPKGKKSLDLRGTVNAGRIARYFKENGIEETSELAALNDAIVLAKRFDIPIHFPIVTLRESVETVRRVKKEGVRISCGTTPFYFTFTEDEPLMTGENAKLLPPLRKEEDRMAVIEGLADGSIDCICSDHMPLSEAEKKGKMGGSVFGAISFETAFAAGVTSLVEPGYLSIYRLVELMAIKSAEILGEDARIVVGTPMNLIFINTEEEMVVSRSTLRSGSCNTPFLGRALRGKVVESYIDGEGILAQTRGKG